jgi:hypothetical protein
MFLVQVLSLFSFTDAQNNNSTPSSYKNLRFWDEDVGNCYFLQVTKNSCVCASIQMVLKYLDFSPLPNQMQLANEMNTDVNSITEWKFTYLPFKNRGFSEYYNQSLSEDFGEGLEYLKGNVSHNFPVIVKTWYDEQAKVNDTITHARVITGFNSDGIFFHDPWVEANQFMNYSMFGTLWNTTGYWAFIVKQEPKFDLVINVEDWLGKSVPDVELTLKNGVNRTGITNTNGTVEFSNLTIGNYALSYDWRFQSLEDDIIFTKLITKNYSVFFSDQIIILLMVIIGLALIAFEIFSFYKKQNRKVFGTI